jgi:hypothetical protein
LETLETLDIPTEPLFLTVPNDFLNTDLAKDFCKTFQNANSLNAELGSGSGLGLELVSESNSLDNKCNSLTSSNCFATDCCVLLNGKTCVSGSKNGPTYLTDSSGAKINMDYYYCNLNNYYMRYISKILQ